MLGRDYTPLKVDAWKDSHTGAVQPWILYSSWGFSSYAFDCRVSSLNSCIWTLPPPASDPNGLNIQRL